MFITRLQKTYEAERTRLLQDAREQIIIHETPWLRYLLQVIEELAAEIRREDGSIMWWHVIFNLGKIIAKLMLARDLVKREGDLLAQNEKA